jgi:hypothetical protein
MGIDLFENVTRNDRVTKAFPQTNIHTRIEAVENFLQITSYHIKKLLNFEAGVVATYAINV